MDPQGRAVIVVEVTRPSPATTPEQLATLARTAIQCGADALCVRLDSEDTPEGLRDLFAVVQVRRGGGAVCGPSWVGLQVRLARDQHP
jgi:hypothetical protein